MTAPGRHRHGLLPLFFVLLLTAALLPRTASTHDGSGENIPPEQLATLIDARNLIDSGQPAKAVELLLPLSRRQHPALAILSHLAWAQAETKDMPGALATYERAAGLYPEDARTRRNLGLILLDQGRLGEAAEALERAYDLQPEKGREPALLAAAASARARMKAYPEALALVTRAEQAAGIAPVAWSSLAVYCCLRLDRPGDAVRQARHCTRLHAKDPAAWKLLGRALARNGDPLAAAAALESADALLPRGTADNAARPDEIAALYALGHAHAEAARWLAESDSPNGSLRAAERLYLTRQNDAALAALDRFRNSGEDSGDRVERLRAGLLRGRILLDEKRPDEAVACLLKEAATPSTAAADKAEHRLRGSLLLLAGETRWMERDWAGAARIFTTLAAIPGFAETGTSLANGMRALISDAALADFEAASVSQDSGSAPPR